MMYIIYIQFIYKLVIFIKIKLAYKILSNKLIRVKVKLFICTNDKSIKQKQYLSNINSHKIPINKTYKI